MLSVAKVLSDMGMWLEEVRQDVCNVQSDVVALQRETERMRAETESMRAETAMLRTELLQIQRKVRLQELAAQEAALVFSAGGEARRRPFALLPREAG